MDNDFEPRVCVEGHIESVIYANADNGWTVFTIRSAALGGEPSEITCTATMPNATAGERVRLTGVFVLHPSYGRQFKAERWEKSLPDTEDGVLKYLGSGVVKGVGKKLAAKIVDKFGTGTLIVLEDNPEKLAEIKGVSLEKALMIGEIFSAQADLRRAMLFLQQYGVSPHLANKIYNRYKDATLDVVRNNPYTLCEDIVGVGFKTADMIAGRVGVPEDSPFRVRAGVQYVLWEGAGQGHVYVPKARLLPLAAELLDLPVALIDAELARLRFERAVWEERLDEETEAVYLNAYYYAECFVAKRLMELSRRTPADPEAVEKAVAALEAERGVYLAENQKLAAAEAMTHGALIITGGPGTGKTTTINTIISLLQKAGKTIELAAPTGRAAKRMAEATGLEAKTLHRLLGLGAETHFTKEAVADKLECDAVIVDETSMVDLMLMYRLLSAVEEGTRLIFVGDVDQLPSVGAGNVLKDMIGSGCLPVVRLTEVFRQAAESAIVTNAHKINHGEYPDLSAKTPDFFFLQRRAVDGCVRTVVELAAERLPKYVSAHTPYDVQVLTPTRKGALGVHALNEALQKALNPPDGLKREMELRGGVLREGDKVMQVKNNYNLVWKTANRLGEALNEGTGVFNGDEGIVRGIDTAARTVAVAYDERLVTYDFSQLDELELAYAVTIHKSQGSEYSAVVIPLHSGPRPLMSRNLLYTAITRAKRLAVLVGVPQTICRMVDNDREVARYTALKQRIQKMSRLQDAPSSMIGWS